MNRSFHIATSESWSDAKENGFYSVQSLKSEGFIHCSFEHQIAPVANFIFKGKTGLVLLEIFANQVKPEIR